MVNTVFSGTANRSPSILNQFAWQWAKNSFKYQDFWEDRDLKNFCYKVLGTTSPGIPAPYFVGFGWFLLSCLLGIAPLYRNYFESICSKVENEVVKRMKKNKPEAETNADQSTNEPDNDE